MSRYRFIAAERGHYSGRRLCQVLGVPPSGYYAWQAGQKQATGPATPAWETALVKAFGHRKRRYGTRRLQVALRQKGHRVGCQRLRRARQRRGLHALPPKAYPPRTTDLTHGLRCAPNRLLDQPKPTQANRVWVSDITYLPRQRLPATAARVRSPALAEPPRRLRRQCPGGKPAIGFGHLWSRLKTEVLERREWPVFADLADAQASIADYFDYYNHDRLHSSIGYHTPYLTHRQLLQTTALNCPA